MCPPAEDMKISLSQGLQPPVKNLSKKRNVEIIFSRPSRFQKPNPWHLRGSASGRRSLPWRVSIDIFRTGIPVGKIPVYRYVIFSYRYFPQTLGKLYKARSQRYRKRFLQQNIRLKGLAEIYTMHFVLQLSNLKMFVESLPNCCQCLL